MSENNDHIIGNQEYNKEMKVDEYDNEYNYNG